LYGSKSMIVLQGSNTDRSKNRHQAHDGLPSGCRLVYNAAMDIPSALLYSILSAIAEAALAPAPDPQMAYEGQALSRSLPDEARQGVMQPPTGDGFVTISGRELPLAPTAQIRSRQNLIVMPMQIQNPVEVVYITDASGAIYRVWMLTPGEASVSRPR
jgi:hypothetical protein